MVGRRLLGLETEFALTAVDAYGRCVDRERVVGDLLEIAQQNLVHLPGGSQSGLFLENGGRLYLDCGLHPEFSTPECVDPRDVVRYARAGERIMDELCTELQSLRGKIADVSCYTCNVDYSGMHSTWGCHESYLYRADPTTVADALVPHLVSRIIYSGAGGVRRTPRGLFEFTLSPRVDYLEEVVSGDSTSNRGIVHSKNEPLCGLDYRRLHLICGESLASNRAAWLKVATTALVVTMVDAGLAVASKLALKSPVDAMRTFARDSGCTARIELLAEREASAVEIQREYLEQVEFHVGAPWMPPWAETVCVAWRTILDSLERDPESLAGTLDWAIKHRIYTRYLASKGLDWGAGPNCTVFAREIVAAVKRFAQTEPPSLPIMFESFLRDDGPYQQAASVVDFAGVTGGYGREELRDLVDVRSELFELDTRWGQVGARGIFHQLDSAGTLDHAVDGIDRIGEAMRDPPEGSRARVRGLTIRELTAAGGGLADWDAIWREEKEAHRRLDLSDPFATTASWRPTPPDEPPLFLGRPSSSPRRIMNMLCRRGETILGTTAGGTSPVE